MEERPKSKKLEEDKGDEAEAATEEEEEEGESREEEQGLSAADWIPRVTSMRRSKSAAIDLSQSAHAEEKMLSSSFPSSSSDRPTSGLLSVSLLSGCFRF